MEDDLESQYGQQTIDAVMRALNDPMFTSTLSSWETIRLKKDLYEAMDALEAYRRANNLSYRMARDWRVIAPTAPASVEVGSPEVVIAIAIAAMLANRSPTAAGTAALEDAMGQLAYTFWRLGEMDFALVAQGASIAHHQSTADLIADINRKTDKLFNKDNVRFLTKINGLRYSVIELVSRFKNGLPPDCKNLHDKWMEAVRQALRKANNVQFWGPNWRGLGVVLNGVRATTINLMNCLKSATPGPGPGPGAPA